MFVCSECSESFLRWMGQCPSCKAWNSLEEIPEAERLPKGKKEVLPGKTAKLNEPASADEKKPRLATCFREFDKMLGGGILAGSVILLGGEPGVGKSTLLLGLAGSGFRTLYVSGEESLAQIRERARRLKLSSENLLLLQENNLEAVLQSLEKEKPALVFIDSIQTIYPDSSRGFSGSVSQIRESTQALLEFAKKNDTPVILTGHITKEGQIAGPKLLEHAVDVVLYFENYQDGRYRFIRSVKNRFGATGEIAVFEMTQTGLKEILPEESILHVNEVGGVGSVLFPQTEGSRVLPLEVQVLVTPAGYSNGRRIGENIDVSRIHLIAAILEKYMGFRLSQTDIYVRVNGGVYLREPGGDLAFLVAMASSYLNEPVPSGWAVAGELSLTGQIRSASGLELRQKSASSLKLSHALWGGEKPLAAKNNSGLTEYFFTDIQKALDCILPRLPKSGA